VVSWWLEKASLFLAAAAAGRGLGTFQDWGALLMVPAVIGLIGLAVVALGFFAARWSAPGQPTL
jgi:hypothetical protein